MKVQKLCLLRLSAIGDVCHAAAMVDRIIQHAPTIEITWIIGKVEYQLLKGMANVRFIVFDKKLGKEAYLKLQSDSINQEASKTNLSIAENQFIRTKTLYEQGLKSLTELEIKKAKLQEEQAKLIAAPTSVPCVGTISGLTACNIIFNAA